MALQNPERVVEMDLDSEHSSDTILLPSDDEELDDYMRALVPGQPLPNSPRGADSPDPNEQNDADLDAELVQIAGNVGQLSSDDEEENDIESDDPSEIDYVIDQGNEDDHPDRPMQLIVPPMEYDDDFYNGWSQIDDETGDPGHPDQPPFMGELATTVAGTAPMDFFEALLRDTIWGELAAQTNAYANARLQKLGPDAAARMDNPAYKRHARMNFWKDVTAEDMRIFAAHLILLGLLKKPDLEDYWSRKALTRTPFFGQYMSRDKFQNILSNFHVADDSQNPVRGQPGHNPLAKIQPFIDLISEAFKVAYKPAIDISVDEGCCPWKGRLHFRQFNPRKPAKFHIKLFQVSDPATGYVLHFAVFTGKGSCHRENIAMDPTCTTTTQTVLTLCSDAQVLDKGHVIYFDNFFTSPELLEELYSRTTLACGTCRPRVRGPLILQAKTSPIRLQPGESCALRNGPILAFKWRQTKPKNVYMMSTKHVCVESFTGKLLRPGNEPIYKPAAVIEYTKKMGGVDVSDQLMNYYHFLRRSVKWWRKLWVHLFNMVIMNAYVLNKSFGVQKSLTHTEYRYTLAAALLNFTELPQIPNPNMPAVPLRQSLGHWPERLPRSTKNNKTKTRKCKYCFVSAKKAARTNAVRNEKSTTIQCSSCRVPLCVYPCFKLYHTT